MYVIYCASSRRWLRDRIKDWPPLLTTLLWQYNRWELQLNEWIYYLVIDKKMNCCYSNHTLNYSKEYTGTKNEYIGNTLLLHQWHWPWMSVLFAGAERILTHWQLWKLAYRYLKKSFNCRRNRIKDWLGIIQVQSNSLKYTTCYLHAWNTSIYDECHSTLKK